MNYIENIYICLAAPLLIAALCMRGRGRKTMVFLIAGTTVCLLSSYINTFIAAVVGVNMQIASIEIAPMTEEIMKFLPILFFLLVFEPTKEDIENFYERTSFIAKNIDSVAVSQEETNLVMTFLDSAKKTFETKIKTAPEKDKE